MGFAGRLLNHQDLSGTKTTKKDTKGHLKERENNQKNTTTYFSGKTTKKDTDRRRPSQRLGDASGLQAMAHEPGGRAQSCHTEFRVTNGNVKENPKVGKQARKLQKGLARQVVVSFGRNPYRHIHGSLAFP